MSRPEGVDPLRTTCRELAVARRGRCVDAERRCSGIPRDEVRRPQLDLVHERLVARDVNDLVAAVDEVPLPRSVAPVAWSDYGDLWMSNFGAGSVSRLRAETKRVDKTIDGVAINGIRRCLERRGGCRRRMGDDSTRPKALADRPEDKPRDPVGMPYPPAGVAADDDGVWVTVGDCGQVIGCRPRQVLASERS